MKRETKQYEIGFARYGRRTRQGFPNGKARKKLVKQAYYAGDNSKDIVEVRCRHTGGFEYASLVLGNEESEKIMLKGHRVRTFIYVLMGLIVFCSSPHLLAQQQDANEPDDFFDMSIEELMEVEVRTASKYKQKISEAPSSVTIITAEEIRKYGYRTLLDILNSIPGFYTTYDRNYGYVGVRGFGRPGDYNSRILVMIDGYRLNDNISDYLGVATDFRLDVDLIEKIEIVRGPGSSLYGSNALFAVINVITKNGKDYKGAEFSSEIASFDTEKARVTYGQVYDNGLDLLASGTYFDRDGDELYYREFDDPSTNNGRVRNDDDSFKNFLIKTSFSDFSFVAAQTDREKGIPTAPWYTVFGDRRTRTRDRITLLGLKYERDFSDDFSILSKLSYNHYNYNGDWVFDDGGGGTYIWEDNWRGQWWIGELQFTKKLSDQHKFVWGAESQYNVQQDQKARDPWYIYLNDKRHSKNWSIYVQDEFKLLDNLIINAGLRRDYYNTFGGTFNPRLALIYLHSEATVLKFIYGKAFRAPNAYELYYSDGGTTSKSNPNLNPETIKTYEVVLERTLNKNLRGTVTGFYNMLENLIGQTTDPSDGLIMSDNLGEVTAKGLEAALDGKWNNGMRGRIGYSFVQTRDKTTGETLANSPKNMVNFNLIYPLVPKELFAGFESKYIGERKTLTGNYEDGSVVTNLTLTYENAAKRMEIQVGVYNLFDVKYGHPGFGEHVQDIIDQDGRTFGIRLTQRF